MQLGSLLIVSRPRPFSRQHSRRRSNELPAQPFSFRQAWLRFSDMSATEYDQLLVGLAAAGAVAAYLSQPLLRFIPSLALVIAGEVVVLALAGGAFLRVFSRRPYMLAAQVGILLFGVLALVVNAFLAIDQSAWNERRCTRIQGAMLHPTANTRSDLPSLFQALGCQPQGKEPRDPDYQASRSDPPVWSEEVSHAQFLDRQLANELPLYGERTAANRANDRRCLFLENDMLSAQPRKPNGAALFQAFGCRPQGEGSVMVPPSKVDLAEVSKRHRAGPPPDVPQGSGRPASSGAR